MPEPATYRCKYCSDWTSEPAEHLRDEHGITQLHITDFTLVRTAQGAPAGPREQPEQDTHLF